MRADADTSVVVRSVLCTSQVYCLFLKSNSQSRRISDKQVSKSREVICDDGDNLGLTVAKQIVYFSSEISYSFFICSL